MFKQLAPLLSTRSLVLTVTSVANERIRVTISPRNTGKDDPKELSEPFAVEGTAEELDAELPQAISGYVADLITLTQSLALVKSNMEAALKEAKAEADKKIGEAKRMSKTGSAAKVEPPKPEVKKPAAPSLFDSMGDAPEAASNTGASAVPAPAKSGIDDDTPDGPGSSEEEEESEEVDQEDETDDVTAAVPEVVSPAVSEASTANPVPTPTSTATSRSTLATSTPQRGIFATATEEEEILQEAFYGTDDSRVAA